MAQQEQQIIPEIVARRSVRQWKQQPVEEDKLTRCLEAVRLAPSAKNLQNIKAIVVRDENKRKALAEAAKGQKFVGEAPIVVVFCGGNIEYKMQCGQFACSADIHIAADHFSLQACREGLGTCWIGAFYEEKVRPIVNVPEGWKIISMMPLGYPLTDVAARPRKKLNEIVSFETFQ